MPLRKQRTPVRALIATALWAGLAIGATGAVADGGAKSSVKLRTVTVQGASGVVKSSRPACRRNREVSIHRRNSFFWEKVATTTTSRSGRWEIERRLSSAKYFAKVEAKRGCRYDVSASKRLR